MNALIWPACRLTIQNYFMSNTRCSTKVTFLERVSSSTPKIGSKKARQVSIGVSIVPDCYGIMGFSGLKSVGLHLMRDNVGVVCGNHKPINDGGVVLRSGVNVNPKRTYSTTPINNNSSSGLEIPNDNDVENPSGAKTIIGKLEAKQENTSIGVIVSGSIMLEFFEEYITCHLATQEVGEKYLDAQIEKACEDFLSNKNKVGIAVRELFPNLSVEEMSKQLSSIHGKVSGVLRIPECVPDTADTADSFFKQMTQKFKENVLNSLHEFKPDEISLIDGISHIYLELNKNSFKYYQICKRLYKHFLKHIPIGTAMQDAFKRVTHTIAHKPKYCL